MAGGGSFSLYGIDLTGFCGGAQVVSGFFAGDRVFFGLCLTKIDTVLKSTGSISNVNEWKAYTSFY